MVGCVTLVTSTTVLPAISPSLPDDTVRVSGPATDCPSGGVPGQIATCVCPGEGCQVDCCARVSCRLKLMQYVSAQQRSNGLRFMTRPRDVSGFYGSASGAQTVRV